MARRSNRRRRIPTVGAHAANQVRLAPGFQRSLHRKAARRARAQGAPAVRAARGAVAADRAAGQAAIGSAQRAFRTEKRAAKGSVGLENAYLSQALASLNSSGLKGRYKKQAAAELASRIGDTSHSLPFLLADARATRNEDVSTARADLASTIAQDRLAVAGARGDIRADTASKFASLQDSALTDAQSAVKSKRSAAKSAREAGGSGKNQDFKDSVNAALKEANRLLRTYADKPPRNPKEWALFAGELQKADGVTEAGAGSAAVKILLQRAHKQVTKLKKQHSPVGLLFGG